jgi:hypothetical protein
VAVRVVALDGALARVPDLDGAVLGARHHPLALAVEGDARDVVRVALECENGVRVRRFDVVEFDRVVAGGCQVAFVGGDAKAIDLGVRVWNCARADAGERFPEAWAKSLVRCAREKREWNTTVSCDHTQLHL